MTVVASPTVPSIQLDREDRPPCGYCEVPSAATLIEVRPQSNEFVARCMAHLEDPIAADEPRFTKNGNPAFILTLDQRNAIFNGDHTAIKLQPGEAKPDIEPGQITVLAESKGGMQFLAKTDRERNERIEKGLPLLTEIPSTPTVWIVFKQPQLKEGRWVVEFTVHDIREPVRTLAAAPSGPRQAGLKTRQKRRVAKRKPYREKAPSDADRGYGGGNSTVDEREGVDDTTLAGFASSVAEQSADQRKVKLLRRRVRALHGELVKAEAKDRHRTAQTIRLEIKSNEEEIQELLGEVGSEHG